MTGDVARPWRDALADLVAAAPCALRALASDELHIGGFTNVQLDHPVLDLRAVPEDRESERALAFFLAAALLHGATVARVHVARGDAGRRLARLARRRYGAVLERVDDESVALLRYFDAYLRPATAIDEAAGRTLARRVAAALATG